MNHNKDITSIAEERTHELLQSRTLLRHRFFLTYVFDILRHARVYLLWKELLSYFRKFRLVAILIRVFTFLITILETGALVVFSTLLFLVLLPLLGAWMLGILLTALIEARKSNRVMQERLQEKKVYLLSLSKEENPFFSQNARALARDEKSAVLVLSPYWISGKGIDGNRFYCTVREDGENVYLVRKYYFFTLKKRVLADKELICVF